jgi:hypothetical protein
LILPLDPPLLSGIACIGARELKAMRKHDFRLEFVELCESR